MCMEERAMWIRVKPVHEAAFNFFNALGQSGAIKKERSATMRKGAERGETGNRAGRVFRHCSATSVFGEPPPGEAEKGES